jgi:hypothetical protein
MEIPMYAGNGRMWAVILCVSFALPRLFLGQQEPTIPRKDSTPEQEAYRQCEAKYRGLHAQAKQVFDTEMAREKAGDCPDAKTDYDFNVCYGKQLLITDQNLKSYEGFIRELAVPPPQMPGQPAVERSLLPAHGIAEPVLSSPEFGREFERIEQSWGQYRERASAAALHQFEGGHGWTKLPNGVRAEAGARPHARTKDDLWRGTASVRAERRPPRWRLNVPLPVSFVGHGRATGLGCAEMRIRTLPTMALPTN